MKRKILKTAITTLGITTATMAQTVPSYVPTNGLLGWWPFSNSAADMGGNSHNGTVNGALLTTDRFGNANAAYSFDGVDDFIQTEQITDDLTEFTISLWFQSAKLPEATEFKGLIGKGKPGETGEDNSTFYVGFNNTSLQLGFENSSGDNKEILLADPCALLYSWKNIVITFNKTDKYLRTFVNGIRTDSVFATFTPVHNSLPLIFGNSIVNPVDNSMTKQCFKGQIDDIGVWKRALSLKEVQNLYQNIEYQKIATTDTLFINMGISSANPISYNNSIKIYPNPAKDQVTIDYGDYESLSGYQIKIDNSLGQEMFQTTVTQKTSSIKLNTWTGNGMYYVKVIDPKGNTIDIKKIILQ